MPRMNASTWRRMFAQVGPPSRRGGTGNGGKRPRGPREKKFIVPTTIIAGDAITIAIPMQTVSSKSAHEMPWAVAKRNAAQRDVVLMELLRVRDYLSPLPVYVTLIRFGPNALDAHDNLRMALAAVVDAVAEHYGIADCDPQIAWKYGQMPKSPYGVSITIAPASGAGERERSG